MRLILRHDPVIHLKFIFYLCFAILRLFHRPLHAWVMRLDFSFLKLIDDYLFAKVELVLVVSLASDSLRFWRINHTGAELVHLFERQFLGYSFFFLLLITPFFIIQLNNSQILELKLLFFAFGILSIQTFSSLFPQIIKLFLVLFKEGLFLPQKLCQILKIFLNHISELHYFREQRLTDFRFVEYLILLRLFIQI